MPTILAQYHSSGAEDPATVSLAGKTNGKDIIGVVYSAAFVTAPAPWVVLESETNGGQYDSQIIYLPAASVTAGVTQVVFDHSAAANLTAILWQDYLDVPSIYADLRFLPGVSNDTPALGATGVHTFGTLDHAFAFFGVTYDPGSDGSFAAASYDQGYSGFADSGSIAAATGTVRTRGWVAKKDSTSFTADGVTVTYNAAKAGHLLGNAGIGMLAYDVLADPVEEEPPEDEFQYGADVFVGEDDVLGDVSDD